jgi:hypothetical protein
MRKQLTRRLRKSSILTSLIVSCCCYNVAMPALSQNNFFGSNPGANINPNQMGSSKGEDDGAAGPGLPIMNGALPPPAPAGGDYTQDEKRMQKKYHGNLRHAQDLVRQGEAMMKQAGNNKEDKNDKKGKVLKEIGEKSLGDLKAGNPFDVDKEKPIYAERKHKTPLEKQVNP